MALRPRAPRVAIVVAGSQSITGVGFSDADAFGAGVVTRGPRAITGVGFADGDAFGAGTITRGARAVTGVGFADADGFGAGVISRASLQTISGAGFSDPDAFGSGQLGPPGAGMGRRRRRDVPEPPNRARQAEEFERRLSTLLDAKPAEIAAPAPPEPPAEAVPVYGPAVQPDPVDRAAAHVQALRAAAERVADDATALRLLREAEEEEEALLLLLA